jgi:hypothetical protein
MWEHLLHRYMSETHTLCLKNTKLHHSTTMHLSQASVTCVHTAIQCIKQFRHDEVADTLNDTDKHQEAVGMYHLAKVAQPEL